MSLPLFNLVLCWLFLGFLTAHLAKKREKNPKIWFWVGLTMGLFGILVLYLMPKPRPKAAPKPIPRFEPPPPPEETWYYFDAQKIQKGPISRSELKELLDKKMIHAESFVWTSGQETWKRIHEVETTFNPNFDQK